MKEVAVAQKAILGRAVNPRALVLFALGAVACRPGGVRMENSASHASSSLGSSSTPAAEGPEITVVSYNVNYGLASCEGGRCSADAETVRLIESIDADVLVLQETTPAWEKVLRPLLAGRFPHATCHDPTTYVAGGNCTFSKLAITEDEALPSPVGWFPANRLVVESESGPIEILNVHMRPQISESGSWVAGHFSTGGLRKREIDSYTPSFRRGLPTIVAGDFNEDVGGDALDALGDLGFETGFEAIGPKKKTWHYTAYSIPLAMTLDHVAFEREHFEAVAVEVLEGGRSDHQPVKVTLRMKR
jgi:endonuclease/exonuclease/phosphatase family metal-dependent hydrolase